MKTFGDYLVEVDDDPESFEDAVSQTLQAVYQLLVARRRVRGPGNVNRAGTRKLVDQIVEKAHRLDDTTERYLSPDADDEIRQEFWDSLGDIIGWTVMEIVFENGWNNLPLRGSYDEEKRNKYSAHISPFTVSGRSSS